MDKIKIVYLTGFWYSGATILGRALKSSEQAIYVGEIRDYWTKGFGKNEPCSCGVRFKDCKFWQEVTNEYLKSFPSIDIEKVTKELFELERTRNYFRLKRFLKKKSDNHTNYLLKNYLTHVEKLYEAIARVSGKSIIIDSSRLPGRLLALSASDKLELYPIYLIRDPRGVINSLIKKDIRNYGENRHSTFKHTLIWNAKNLLSLNSLKHSHTNNNVYIWYENFTRHPVTILENLKKILNWKFNYEELNGKVSLNLEPGHVFTGNRSRNESGKITINEDAKWKRELDWPKKVLISLNSLPLLKIIVRKYHLK